MMQLLSRRVLGARPAATGPRRSARRTFKAVPVRCYKEDGEQQQEPKPTAKVTFQLPKHVEWGQDVCLVGEAEALGSWDVSKCVPMAWHDGDVWTAEAAVPAGEQVQYKYVVRGGSEPEEKEVLEWQPCDNLELQCESAAAFTVRDTFGGDAHEVLPGTLPISEPPAAPEAAAEPPAAEAAAEAPVQGAAVVAAAGAPEAAPLPPPERPGAALDDEAAEAPVATAEQIADAETTEEEPAPQGEGRAAAPAVALGGSNGGGAGPQDSAPHKAAATPGYLRRKASSGEKRQGRNKA